MLDRYAGHSFLQRPLRVVVDLGMNRGDFSTPISEKYGATIVGLEADRALALDLGCEWGAIAGHDGEVQLNPTGTDPSIVFGEGGDPVPAITLASFLKRHDLDHVDLLKLDVEGAELAVIDGDDWPLKICDQITIEFHDFIDPSLASRVALAKRRLRDLGFVELRFSGDNSDVLFARGVGPLLRAWLLLRYRYLRGALRVLRRTFSRD